MQRIHRQIEKLLKKISISNKSEMLLSSLISDSKNSIIQGFSLSENIYIEKIFNGDNTEYLRSKEDLVEKKLINYNADRDILTISKKISISNKSEMFLSSLISDSKNSIIQGFSLSENIYIEKIFNGDNTEYLRSKEELAEKKLINYNADQDILTILVLLTCNLKNLLYGLKETTRKYVREPIKRQSIFDVIKNQIESKLEDLIGTSPYDFKGKGFKVFESFMPYLNGQPMTEQDRDILLTYNPEMIYLEEKRRNMPKNSIIALCACLIFMDEDGIIDDCSEHSLIQNVYKEFGEDSFCVQTWYNSIDTLKEVKLIEEFKNENGCNCICVNGIKESQGERYVIIPQIVFERDFRRLELAGVKIFFDIMFGLNNGERKQDDGTFDLTGAKKEHFIKAEILDMEEEEKREKFKKKLLLQYKKRYPNELRIAMFGDAAKSEKQEKLKSDEFKALRKYFHFHYVTDTSIMARVRKEYFIQKEASTECELEERYKRKKQLIEGLLNDHKIDYKPNDMKDLISVFRRTNRRIISLIMSILADRIHRWKDQGWSEIRSYGAYARKLLQEYNQNKFCED